MVRLEPGVRGEIPQQYRCRLGCILLKTAATLSLTGHGDDAHGHSHGGVGDIAVRRTVSLLESGLHSSKSASDMTAAGRGEAAGGEGEQAAGGAERVHGRTPDPEGAQGEGAALHGTPLYDHQPQPTRLCNYMYSV